MTEDPDPVAAQQRHGVQADVDIRVHQTAIGKTGPLAIHHPDQGVGILQTLAVPAQADVRQAGSGVAVYRKSAIYSSYFR